MRRRGLSESNVLSVFVAVAVLAVAVLYFTNIGVSPEITYATTTTMPTATTSPTTSSSTTTETAATSTTLTTQEPEVTTTVPTTTTVQAASTTYTSTTLKTQTKLPSYLSQYSGKGYHRAYMEITFFCPSCVPAVAANLRNTPGVLAKDMSYKQKLSWVIYDPERVSLGTILMIAGGNGDVTLISDEEV